MISCTEFIPAYSTLFTYLEETFGPDKVPAYWEKHFDPKRAPLYKFLSTEGLDGCWSCWTGTGWLLCLFLLYTIVNLFQEISHTKHLEELKK